MAQVERRELYDEPTSALVFAVSSMVRAHRDRVEDAQVDRKRATDLLTILEDQAPWFEAEARIALARAALRLGDVTGARTVLGEASRTVSRARQSASSMIEPSAKPPVASTSQSARCSMSRAAAFARTATAVPAGTVPAFSISAQAASSTRSQVS